MVMKKSIGRTLAHIDVAANTSVRTHEDFFNSHSSYHQLSQLSGYRVYEELDATNQLTDHEGVHFANKTGCIFQFLSLDAASRGIESQRFPRAPRNGPPRGKNMESNNEKSENA